MTARSDRLERGRQVLRLQGRADAVVMLVATRFRPGLTLDDYARVLDVPAAEVTAELARRRGETTASKPPPRSAASPCRRARTSARSRAAMPPTATAAASPRTAWRRTPIRCRARRAAAA